MNYFIARSTSAIRRAVASKAATIFSPNISLASRRPMLPPLHHPQRNYPICFDCHIIKELNIRRPLTNLPVIR